MSSRRSVIEMTDEEIDAFVSTQTTLVLGSTLPNGRIHLVAMWYALRDDAIWCWTYRRSQKAKNLARSGAVSGLIESGTTYETLQGASLYARAHLVEDTDTVLEVGTLLYERYRALGTAIDLETFLSSASKRVAFWLEVEEWVSWDHHKLGGSY
ncbi:MAG: pyridoxamine 5'-phosphate oxidase family protein [Ferrimicrobium sp.]